MAGRLLLLFIAMPLIELWLLIQVGSVIGALWTIFLVIMTALIGSQLVRRQGLGIMQRVREYQARGEVPALPMLEGLALLLAGFCLIMPGLISDAFGFLMLIPPLRSWVARKLLLRTVTVHTSAHGSHGYGPRPGAHGKHRNARTIEGDYERKE
ncbi:MAG TPA: FxsA family protein [Salinisphaeraceae bacterium]|nr:FxsA family protein [Salinisphaeraceae bacterium]